MSRSIKFKTQLQQNLLALISLIIAIVALSYNSWRNEQSEDNRNFRSAGFEIMRESAKLQLLIDTVTYADKTHHKELIKGWVSINFVVSLSELMTPQINNKAIELKQVWTDNWSSLSTDEPANQKISTANSLLVKTVRMQLLELK